MAVSVQEISAPVGAVFDVLLDPRTYPDWLVGAKEIRSVEDGWPTVGSRFHHRVGLGGPVVVDDNTKVLAIDAPNLLQLEVRARPMGRGMASFRLTPTGDSDDAGCRVEIDEVPIGLLAPLKPLLDPLTKARNNRSLTKLSELVEARTRA